MDKQLHLFAEILGEPFCHITFMLDIGADWGMKDQIFNGQTNTLLN